MSSDVLKGLTKRQLEELKEQIERELESCLVCGEVGALPVQVRVSHATYAALLLCKPCLEKHRLPERRAKADQKPPGLEAVA